VLRRMRGGASLAATAFDRSGTNRLGTGHLDTIDNQIDPTTGTFRCKAVFDNADGALYPNQFLNARLQVDVRRHALTVPTAAVQHGAQGTYVYVVGADKTAEMRPVQVAMAEGTMTVVTGVNEGEQVVTEGADKLQPHGKVEIGREQQGQGKGPGHRRPS